MNPDVDSATFHFSSRSDFEKKNIPEFTTVSMQTDSSAFIIAPERSEKRDHEYIESHNVDVYDNYYSIDLKRNIEKNTKIICNVKRNNILLLNPPVSNIKKDFISFCIRKPTKKLKIICDFSDLPHNNEVHPPFLIGKWNSYDSVAGEYPDGTGHDFMREIDKQYKIDGSRLIWESNSKINIGINYVLYYKIKELKQYIYSNLYR